MTKNRDLFNQKVADLSKKIDLQSCQLPPSVRYYEDYEDVVISIEDPETNHNWRIKYSGGSGRINFGICEPRFRLFLKCWIVWLLGVFQPRTAYNYSLAILNDPEAAVQHLNMLLLNPNNLHKLWLSQVFSREGNQDFLCALKSVLRFACALSIGGLSEDYSETLRLLPLGSSLDKYRVVRDGSVFISTEEEAKIVNYLDDMTRAISENPKLIEDTALRDCCVMYWIYAHGVRPIQVANRNILHMKITRFVNESPAVHLVFRHAKQRQGKRNREDIRSMKRDWAGLMHEWYMRRTTDHISYPSGVRAFTPDRKDSLFGASPNEISLLVGDLMEQICERRISASSLRHTAAMRMVDAGASALELAEFMMHADMQTGQVYYDASPTQADRINKALGLSPVYSDLTAFIGGQTISRFDMDNLDPDQQIGAAPHGRAIIGIGGCGSGQSICAKNPGLSCYTCHKFMPLTELGVHEDARNNVAEIVHEFIEAGKDGLKSPAFMQLRRTLESIDALINELPYEEGASNE